MVGGYVDVVVYTCALIFGADLIQRLFYILVEYIRNRNSYLPERRLTTIVKRAYTYHPKTKVLALAVTFTGLIRFGKTGILYSSPSFETLILIPLYWTFSYVQVGHSSLSYARLIRGTHGLDYAAGMASNYFHGYLNLSLPERENEGLQRRMEAYEDANKVTFAIKRLIILVPDGMFVNGVIKSNLLEKVHPLETQYINRAGVNRPFKHAVYRLTEKINGQTYYIAMEGATPMLSFFESMHFEMSATWQMHAMKREIWLNFCKHLKQLLNSWPATRREVDLVIYSCKCMYVEVYENDLKTTFIKAHKPNGEPLDVGEVVMQHVLTDFEKDNGS